MNKAEAAALSIIKSRRLSADLRVETLLRTLREDKEFAEAESLRDSAGFKMAGLRYRKMDIGDLKEQYDSQNARLFKRLAELNYTPDELVPHRACKLCDDTGFINGRLCECVTLEAYSMLKDNCTTLATDTDDFTKVSYAILPEDERRRYALAAGILKKFAEVYPDNKTDIIMLTGSQGTGKTYLMSVLANALMKRCVPVLFYNAVRLNELFLKYHLAPIEEKEELFAPLVDAGFLVIDDLGAENLIKNVTETYLYELIVLRENKATGITTNMLPEQLMDHYGHRIASRLCSREKSVILRFDGTDLRLFRK